MKEIRIQTAVEEGNNEVQVQVKLLEEVSEGSLPITPGLFTSHGNRSFLIMALKL